ncbi:MAG TPA: chemotaxis protein CheW [Thermoanaerobaculia bacterium]
MGEPLSAGKPEAPAERKTRREGTHLLVRAGEYACALPLAAVRRVVRALTVHPLPGAAGELEGLAEFGGEPLPVLNLARLVNASPGANPSYPVTVVIWVGPAEAREMIGFAADAALEVVHVPAESIVAGGDGGFLQGEAAVGGEVVRILNLEALGR